MTFEFEDFVEVIDRNSDLFGEKGMVVSSYQDDEDMCGERRVLVLMFGGQKWFKSSQLVVELPPDGRVQTWVQKIGPFIDRVRDKATLRVTNFMFRFVATESYRANVERIYQTGLTQIEEKVLVEV